MHVKFSTLLALALSISLAYGCDSDDSNDTTYDYDSGVELDNDLSNADSFDTPDDSTTSPPTRTLSPLTKPPRRPVTRGIGGLCALRTPIAVHPPISA